MSYTYNPVKIYKQVDTEPVDSNHLLVLLFEGAVKLLQDGRRHLMAHNYEHWAHCSNQVRRILSELIIALDEKLAPKLCKSLKVLYVYIQRLITEGGLEEDDEKLQEAINLLNQLVTVWKEAKDLCQKQDARKAA